MQSRYDAFANLRPCSTGATSPRVAGFGGDFPEVISRKFTSQTRYKVLFLGEQIPQNYHTDPYICIILLHLKWVPLNDARWGCLREVANILWKPGRKPFPFQQNQGFLWHTHLQLWNKRQKRNPKEFFGKSGIYVPSVWGCVTSLNWKVCSTGIGGEDYTTPKKNENCSNEMFQTIHPLHLLCMLHLLKYVHELTKANGATLNFHLFESSYT